MDSSPPAATLIAAHPSRIKTLARRFDRIFFLTVLIPTLLAAIYFGVIASDVYISESRFVVKNPQRSTQTGLGALLQGTGFSRSQDDTYSVHDFVLSRDALKELDDKLKVRAAFSDSRVDFVNRFPGPLEREPSFEALYRHYLKHVEIEYDAMSSITVLRVRAFTASNAQQVNEMLLQMGERLVNNLNTRSRQDLIQVAQQEVRVAEERSKASAAALASFRSDRGVFDPSAQSGQQLLAVGRLREELLNAESQLLLIKQVSPNNPQIGGLTTRVETLREAIASENSRVLSREGGLSSKSPAFDRLSLEKTFADRQLAGAMAALDTARSEAIRKQLYLERLVQPNLPDASLEPRRLRSVLMVLFVGLLLWGVVSLVVASVREHTE